MGKLDGRVVILTGASGGIGKQVAMRLAEEGANLTICARTTSKLETTKKLCEERGAKVLAVTCDVSNYEKLQDMVKQTVDTFGRIDVLINNAMSGSLYVPFENQTVEDFEGYLNSNLYPTVHLMQLCYPYLKESGHGSIINIGSGSSDNGLAGCAAYASIKGAIKSLTKVVASEWGKDGIRVNCLAPAAVTENLSGDAHTYEIVKEKMSANPLCRPGDPYADIAPVYVFLASDDSAYMTGQTIHVEGGALMYF